jgi:chromosome partitioning protein
MSIRHIAVFSGKGGVGKSTLSAALAQLSGAVLVDCDPQLTATDWGDRREASPEVVSAQLGRVPVLLEQHARAVIDTPGVLLGNVHLALEAVDLVVLVTGDRQPEIDALPASLHSARQSGTPIVVLINRVHPSSDPNPLQEYIQLLGATVCPIVMRERAAHYHAWAQGQTAIEFDPSSAAAAEVQQVWSWLNGQA